MVMQTLSITIGVRFEKKDKELLERVCDARGEDISDFVRRAVRRELAALNFYPDETKKALGIQVQKTRRS
jgi:uncharacterized protein (DUF1778 family)